jgi:hypothetical protein
MKVKRVRKNLLSVEGIHQIEVNKQTKKSSSLALEKISHFINGSVGKYKTS